MSGVKEVVLALIIACVAYVGWALVTDDYTAERPPAPIDTPANVGKCIQGQRVFYHVTRGEAAETCLASLDEKGAQSFDREWSGFETEDGMW